MGVQSFPGWKGIGFTVPINSFSTMGVYISPVVAHKVLTRFVSKKHEQTLKNRQTVTSHRDGADGTVNPLDARSGSLATLIFL